MGSLHVPSDLHTGHEPRMPGMWFGKENFLDFIGERVRGLVTARGRGPEVQRASVRGYGRARRRAWRMSSPG